MKISFTLTEVDYLQFNLFHIKNSTTGKRTLTLLRYMTPLIFIGASVILSILLNASFIVFFSVFLVASILWVMFYPKFFYRNIKRTTLRIINEGKNEGLIGEHHLTLTEDGVSDLTAVGEMKSTWSGIKKIEEDLEHFYLYNSSVSAYIIPKRALQDEQELRNYIQMKLSQFHNQP